MHYNQCAVRRWQTATLSIIRACREVSSALEYNSVEMVLPHTSPCCQVLLIVKFITVLKLQRRVLRYTREHEKKKLSHLIILQLSGLHFFCVDLCQSISSFLIKLKNQMERFYMVGFDNTHSWPESSLWVHPSPPASTPWPHKHPNPIPNRSHVKTLHT